jgi:hypothetical protein
MSREAGETDGGSDRSMGNSSGGERIEMPVDLEKLRCVVDGVCKSKAGNDRLRFEYRDMEIGGFGRKLQYWPSRGTRLVCQGGPKA